MENGRRHPCEGLTETHGASLLLVMRRSQRRSASARWEFESGVGVVRDAREGAALVVRIDDCPIRVHRLQVPCRVVVVGQRRVGVDDSDRRGARCAVRDGGGATIRADRRRHRPSASLTGNETSLPVEVEPSRFVAYTVLPSFV